MIPKTMSTQHPDNALMPSWGSSKTLITNEDEIEEAYIAYKKLGIKEVMWDAEGKDVDTHVIRKLFVRDREFFHDKVLGKDIFLTYRVPNPLIEGAERKILNETLNSIPLNYDVANRIFNNGIAPIFEVILPFTTDYRSMLNVKMFYEKGIVDSENINLYENVYSRDITGEVLPRNINIIPLIEDKDSILDIESIIKKYYYIAKPEYMRIFIARSDPAMNYGMVPATLLSKYAVSKMKKISQDTGMETYPIIGAGSSPFRGNLGPDNIKNALEEYNSYYTFSVQSAFRYDYCEDNVKKAISLINNHVPKDPEMIDVNMEKVLKEIVDIYSNRFQKIIEGLAQPINDITFYLPKRRARKLHTGLFGYSRSTGTAKLPRAISFVGALYSIGIPPEILGIASLAKMPELHQNILNELYHYMESDIRSSAKYFNYSALSYLRDIWKVDGKIIQMIGEDVKYVENNIGVPTDIPYNVQKHSLYTTLLLMAFKNRKFDEVRQYIYEMAILRKFIG
jgi:phosphoenolpyruvate carboxylase